MEERLNSRQSSHAISFVGEFSFPCIEKWPHFFPPSLHGVSIFLIFSLWIDGSEKGLPAGPKHKSAKLVHILRDIPGTFCLEQRLTLSWGQVNLH